ncbi:MAG: hypothetical protein SF029_14285 [bacterium]|nr:hypothetical protein [bacterium]
MPTIFQIAWKRFNTLAAVLGDVQGRVIMTAFYFTILLPFGLISRLTSDPLRRRDTRLLWLERAPVPEDLDSARQQG